MGIVIVCCVLLAAGLAAGVGWGGRPFVAPDLDTELTAGEVARRYVWYSAIVFTAGIAAGVTVIGAGGRLAMRLLAVTAGDAAQGRVTEADQVVGAITVDGTKDFILFNGVFGGLIFGGLYLLIRRFLPSGRLGGVTYGLGLLVVFGAIMDPLRKENPDFDLVGPGWVAVLVFTLLAVAFGLAIAGFTARASTWLPLLSTERRVLLRYAFPAVLAAIAFPMTILLAAVGVVVVLVTRWRPVVDVVRSRPWIIGGIVVLTVVVLASLPNTVSNVADIAGR